MAELEVVKHTKKVYKVFHSENPVVEKIKEFLIEIFIIVFAVSLTIWFHDLAEHRHHQKEVKEFLLGLKTDLAGDLKEMESDKRGYQFQQTTFRFFGALQANMTVETDTLRKYTGGIFNQIELVQNSGRYEGFKSAGKLGNIENKKLQNDIVDLYQELIPSLLNTTQIYNAQKDRLVVFIEQNAHINPEDGRLIVREAMQKDQAKIMTLTLTFFPTEIVHRYDVCMDRIREIVKTIDEEYPQ